MSIPVSLDGLNSHLAIQAAQSGLSDYEARVDMNQYYPIQYNWEDNYIYTEPDGTKVKSQNPAFSGWVLVPGTRREWYSYQVVPTGNVTTNGSPTYTLVVAGCGGVLSGSTVSDHGKNYETSTSNCRSAPGNEVDIIAHQFRMDSPFYNAYFTKYEMHDPSSSSSYPSNPDGYPPDPSPSTTESSQMKTACSVLPGTSNPTGQGLLTPPLAFLLEAY